VVRPPVFQAETYDEAVRRAADEGRWAIVFATTPSSDLCATMDEITWRNDKVCAWIEEHAVAAQIDVGADELLARRLKLTAPPAVIAFKDGQEKSRMEGFRNAHHMRLWFMTLEGKATRFSAALRSRSGDLDEDMHGRLDYARALLERKRYPEATEHYVWMWKNIDRVQPSMRGVRVSFMAGEMERLAGADAAARARFAALRDEAGAAADAQRASVRDRVDWVVLNKIVGEQDRTLAWFDGAKADAREKPVIQAVSRLLAELLKEKGRWADLGRLHGDPLKELAFQHEASSVKLPDVPGLPAAARENMRAVMAQQFRNAAAALVGSLWVAGRTDEASAVRAEAVRLDPSDEMKRALAEGPFRAED
jgi:hypothetical protein